MSDYQNYQALESTSSPVEHIADTYHVPQSQETADLVTTLIMLRCYLNVSLQLERYHPDGELYQLTDQLKAVLNYLTFDIRNPLKTHSVCKRILRRDGYGYLQLRRNLLGLLEPYTDKTPGVLQRLSREWEHDSIEGVSDENYITIRKMARKAEEQYQHLRDIFRQIPLLDRQWWEHTHDNFWQQLNDQDDFMSMMARVLDDDYNLGTRDDGSEFLRWTIEQCSLPVGQSTVRSVASSLTPSLRDIRLESPPEFFSYLESDIQEYFQQDPSKFLTNFRPPESVSPRTSPSEETPHGSFGSVS